MDITQKIKEEEAKSILHQLFKFTIEFSEQGWIFINGIKTEVNIKNLLSIEKIIDFRLKIEKDRIRKIYLNNVNFI